MNRMIPLLPLLLLMPSVAIGAEPATPVIPQPVVLDWGGDFRLNSPPVNAAQAGLTKPVTGQTAPVHQAESHPTSPTVAALGPSDPTRTRTSNRPLAPDATMLSVDTPLSAGPVSVGASYGKYRAVPTTREVSAHDARVSLGLHF